MDSHGLPSMGCESSTQRSEGGQLQPRRMLGVNELLNAAPPAPPPTPWPNRALRPRQNQNQHQHPNQIHNHNQNPNLPVPDVQMQGRPGHTFPDPRNPPYAQYDYMPYQVEGQGMERLPQLPFPLANRRYNIPRDGGNDSYENNNHGPQYQIYGPRHHLPLPPPSPPLRRDTANWPTNKMARQEREGPVMKKCTVCLDEFVGADTIAMNFPYKCDTCSAHMICLPCLKDWFIDACKNEFKMPPRCCTVIPLSVVVHSLTQEQIDLYKAKFEEWRTPDRFYCPVPTCSTFIPPRLLKEMEEYHSPPIRQTSLGYLISDEQKDNTIPDKKHSTLSHSHLPLDNSMLDVEGKIVSSDSPNTTILRTIVCPTCAVTICTRCRQLVHPGTPCPKTDIDPLLAAQLEKWKIKRCPKCRAGVRRMFGCSHIECRCGAHFCFACLCPINECDGQCDDDDYDEDALSATGTLDPEDLDGQMAFNGTELNLGNEPYNPVIDDWSCHHDFRPIYNEHPSNERVMPALRLRHHHAGPLDCQVCWKVLHPVNLPGPTASTESDTEMIGTSRGISTEPGWPTTINGEPAWMCMGRHINCDLCPKDPVYEIRTYKYRCEHRHLRCLKCEAAAKLEDRAAVEEETKLGGDRGYECHCGMVVCGDCKDGVERDY